MVSDHGEHDGVVREHSEYYQHDVVGVGDDGDVMLYLGDMRKWLRPNMRVVLLTTVILLQARSGCPP